MKIQKKEIKTLGRLRKRSDFLYVQHNGRKWVPKGFIVQLAEGKNSENTLKKLRYGLTVTKRVSKSAVVRNRIKRRLKAVACDVLPTFSDNNVDIVLIGRPITLKRDYEEMKNDLLWSLKRLDIKPNQEK
jgi:ribonuclease P protein component